jgi:Brp/Blh family beta-carotene 15,15'-monooxygenase
MSQPVSRSTPPPTLERLLFPVAAFFVIALLALTPTLLPPTFQLVGLAIVVALFGMPHGALDPWIAEKIGVRRTRRHMFAFHLLYLLIAALVVVIWTVLPVASLLVFLTISAWHFSGDWSHDMGRLTRLGVGLLLLLMPIGFHTENVALLFSYLSGDGGQALAHTLSLPVWFLVVAMLALAELAAWRRQWLAGLELLGLLALAYMAPPLVYFALYFCLLHSPRHLLGLFREAQPSQRPRLIWMAINYTVATLLLLGALAWFWSHQDATTPLNALITKLVFIGLAAVTVPHMLLIGAAHVIHQRPTSVEK